jgi:hypothetical protein
VCNHVLFAAALSKQAVLWRDVEKTISTDKVFLIYFKKKTCPNPLLLVRLWDGRTQTIMFHVDK